MNIKFIATPLLIAILAIAIVFLFVMITGDLEALFNLLPFLRG